jgi:pyridoxal phosphate enzyme (YggS family)
VKYIVPFIHLIHGVDKLKLLHEINKQAEKAGVQVKCLLQLHIAQEETKFGFDEPELMTAIKQPMEHVVIKGLMGMASFTDDKHKIQEEFQRLVEQYKKIQLLLPGIDTLSMGMSGDYKLAIASGSNMVRIGSLLFGSR